MGLLVALLFCTIVHPLSEGWGGSGGGESLSGGKGAEGPSWLGSSVLARREGEEAAAATTGWAGLWLPKKQGPAAVRGRVEGGVPERVRPALRPSWRGGGVWVGCVVISRTSTKCFTPRCRSQSCFLRGRTEPPLFTSLLGELVGRSGHGAVSVASSWLVCPSAHGPRRCCFWSAGGGRLCEPCRLVVVSL